MDKIQELLKLSEEIRNCTKCDLCKTRNNVVVGKGSPNPFIVFVGRDPGKWEDLKGIPFTGESGKMHDEWLEYLELSKLGLEISVLNILKCRPAVNGVLKNRNPTKEEIQKCTPWLKKQIKLLDPKIIVPMGSVACSYFLGKEFNNGILNYAGNFYNSKTFFPVKGYKFYTLIHPSYFLRNQEKDWKLQLNNLKEYLHNGIKL